MRDTVVEAYEILQTEKTRVNFLLELSFISINMHFKQEIVDVTVNGKQSIGDMCRYVIINIINFINGNFVSMKLLPIYEMKSGSFFYFDVCWNFPLGYRMTNEPKTDVETMELLHHQHEQNGTIS